MPSTLTQSTSTSKGTVVCMIIYNVYTNDHGVNLWGHNNTLGLMMSSKIYYHGMFLYLGVGA